VDKYHRPPTISAMDRTRKMGPDIFGPPDIFALLE
jgi:hypothetical protein